MIINSEVLNFIRSKSNEDYKYSISEFFTLIYKKFYKNLNIDFMNYFLDLINYENKFYVDCNKFYEYNIIEPNKDINKFLCDECNFIENKDFICWFIKTYYNDGKKKFQKKYFITPEKFKYCIIKFSKNNMYLDYFLLLEKIYKYYDLYLKMIRRHKLKRKYIDIDDNISDLEEKENYKCFKKQKFTRCSKIIDLCKD